MNVKYHNFNPKKCANSVISFEPYSNVVFSKEPKIWIVQNYSSDKGLTQLRRDYTGGLDLSYLSMCISLLIKDIYAFGGKVYREVLYLEFYSVLSEPFIIDEILFCERLILRLPVKM